MRSSARTDVPIPTPPFWGVREIDVDLDEVYRHLDTHVLFKLHWGGRGVKGEAWQTLLREDFRPRLERMWREQTYLHPRALLGFFPCYALGNDIVVLDPADRESELTRFVCPRQPKGDRICLADFFRPAVDGKPPAELDVIAVQAVTVGSEVTELMAQARGRRRVRRAAVRPRPRRADGRGPGRVAALRARARCSAIAHDAGPALLLGLPGRARAVRAPEGREAAGPRRQIGMTITDGYAPEPEQSTLALIAHHPQAIYFGTRQGRLLPDGSPDDVIRGSSRDPSLFGELDDDDPPDGAVEAEDEPAMAASAMAASSLVVFARRRAEQDPLDLRRRCRRRGAGPSESPRSPSSPASSARRSSLSAARSSSATWSRAVSSRIRWRGRLSAAAMRTNGSRSSGSRPSAASTTVSRFSRRLATAASSSSSARASISSSAHASGQQAAHLVEREQRRAVLDQPLEEGVALAAPRRETTTSRLPGE